MQLYNTALVHSAEWDSLTQELHVSWHTTKENILDQVTILRCYVSRQGAARVDKSLVHLNHGQSIQEATITNQIPGIYLLYREVMARYGGAHSGFITSV